MKLKPFIKNRLAKACVVLASIASFTAASASTVTVGDGVAGGIGYEHTVIIGGNDTATFSNHVGAWSWEDNSLFGPEDDPVGWTHTSNWVAITVTQLSVFTVQIERDANVPWAAPSDPNRKAFIDSMYPSFTLWKGWDNDSAPEKFARLRNEGNALEEFHTYNNHGNVIWAEDLEYIDHANNSTATSVSRSYILKPGKYTMVIGSNAPAQDTNRQGFKATFTTTQSVPAQLEDDGYFITSTVKPFVVAAQNGVTINDTGRDAATDVIEVSSQPKNGSVTLNQNGSFTYTPGQYFGLVGYDYFKYHVIDDDLPASPPVEATVMISSIANMAGCYGGLLKNEDTEETSGQLKLDITAKGTWTSSIVILGKKYSFSGTVGSNGELLVKGRPKLDVEFFLEAHTDGDRHIHAHVQVGNDLFEGEGDRSPFTAAFPPPSVGTHKLAMVHENEDPIPDLLGKGTVKVSKTGAVTIVGKLADKTPFSGGSVLVESVYEEEGPEMGIYIPAFKAPGSVTGDLSFGLDAEAPATGIVVATKPDQTKPVKPGYSLKYTIQTGTP